MVNGGFMHWQNAERTAEGICMRSIRTAARPKLILFSRRPKTIVPVTRLIISFCSVGTRYKAFKGKNNCPYPGRISIPALLIRAEQSITAADGVIIWGQIIRWN
jgi:hypothetical protein